MAGHPTSQWLATPYDWYGRVGSGQWLATPNSTFCKVAAVADTLLAHQWKRFAARHFLNSSFHGKPVDRVFGGGIRTAAMLAWDGFHESFLAERSV